MNRCNESRHCTYKNPWQSRLRRSWSYNKQHIFHSQDLSSWSKCMEYIWIYIELSFRECFKFCFHEPIQHELDEIKSFTQSPSYETISRKRVPVGTTRIDIQFPGSLRYLYLLSVTQFSWLHSNNRSLHTYLKWLHK